MARTTGVSQTIICVDCSAPKKVTWWYGDRSAEWNEDVLRKECGGCGSSHWSFPTSRGTATARSTKLTSVVYQLPDGDYMVPDSNDPTTETARTAAECGIRREFNSLRELDQFQKEQANRKREHWQRMIDDGYFEGTGLEPTYQQLEEALYRSARNDVREFTAESIAAGKGIRKEIHEARERMFEENARRKKENWERLGVRVGRPKDNARYERIRGRR